jgi:hypothetical protein
MGSSKDKMQIYVILLSRSHQKIYDKAFIISFLYRLLNYILHKKICCDVGGAWPLPAPWLRQCA